MWTKAGPQPIASPAGKTLATHWVSLRCPGPPPPRLSRQVQKTSPLGLREGSRKARCSCSSPQDLQLSVGAAEG